MYDDDFEFLHAMSQPCVAVSRRAGEESRMHVADACSELNGGLTRAFDEMFGPDQVDAFDASCNTCTHFVRKPMTPEEKAGRNLFGMPGHCAKKDVPVRGWQRGQYCGFENADCYENRRTGMRPQDACKPGSELEVRA